MVLQAMNLLNAQDWITDVIDVLDIEYNKTESKKYYSKTIAHNFQSCKKGELALCTSNSIPLLLDVATTTLMRSVKSFSKDNHLIVVPAEHKIDLGMRLLAIKSNASFCNYKSGDMDDSMWPPTTDSVAYWHNKPIFVINYNDIQHQELNAEIDKTVHNYDINKITFIACCDLIKTADKNGTISRFLDNTTIKDNTKIQLFITASENEISICHSIDSPSDMLNPDYMANLIENEKGNVFCTTE